MVCLFDGEHSIFFKGLTNERNITVETPSSTPTEMLNLEQVVFKMESKDYVPQDAILFARICLVPDLTHGRFIILFAFTILVCTRFYCLQTSKRACQWKGKTPLFDRFFQVDTCNFDEIGSTSADAMFIASLEIVGNGSYIQGEVHIRLRSPQVDGQC